MSLRIAAMSQQLPVHPLAEGASAPPASPVHDETERRRRAAESRVEEISSLLSALEQATLAATKQASEQAAVESAAPPVLNPLPAAAPPVAEVPSPTHAAGMTFTSPENKLVLGRLGLASSLFTALRHRHAATADHSLRVALGCSAWASYKQLDAQTRDVLELAALLHDVGSIGLPDSLLSAHLATTPADLAQRAALRRATAAEILAGCACPARVIDVVRHVDAAFNSDNGDLHASGDGIPLEARMIAVVDAYDALTASAHNGSLSRDEALAELTRRGGIQLDPILVTQFSDVLTQGSANLTDEVVARWLSTATAYPWHVDCEKPTGTTAEPAPAMLAGPSLFEQKLIDAMHDGVVFVDAQRRIILWSKGSERLTGVSAGAAASRRFVPSLLDMCNSGGRRVTDDACPVARAINSNSQIRQRMQILGRGGKHVAIDLHAIPVLGKDHSLIGATVLLHDAQPEATLEEKCQALHAKATKDPMTKVANRAEFDRMQLLFMEAHEQADQPCSLIMTDIDHFKSINDTYGHQSGDEAIIAIANLLKEMCRSGDLVARYGGEEFAVLCADCTMDDAARRADQIRRKLSETPLSFLGNRRLTASFGVTQQQPGDTPEAMLRRADLALYTAKEKGRNQVVKMGDGMEETPTKRRWWSFGSLRPAPLITTKLTCEVPKNVALEMLRGFITDMQARIVWSREDQLEIEVSSDKVGRNRRGDDRPALFRVQIDVSETRRERTNGVGLARGSYLQCVLAITIRSKRNRNRRQLEMADRARLILQSLKGYLMAAESEGDSADEASYS
ncbi:MAG: diguanylate cyclase [Pirellulales bacterium]|nr:diguanylate cyclase [Pirellulales bacterium]